MKKKNRAQMFALALILTLFSYLGRDLNPHGRESKGF